MMAEEKRELHSNDQNMEINKNRDEKQKEVDDDFMEWEERDEQSISLFKHCIAGKS